jgi:hypothetical protein
MRIYDDDSDKAVANVTLLLTLNEAEELKSKLADLIRDYGKKEHHEHINDNDYKHEITVAVYNTDNISDFNPRMQQLILDDR